MFSFLKNNPSLTLRNLEKILLIAWPTFIESKNGLIFLKEDWSCTVKKISEMWL